MHRFNPQSIRKLRKYNALAVERLEAAGWNFAGSYKPCPATGSIVWLVVGSLDGDLVVASAGDKAAAWGRAIEQANRRSRPMSRTA